MKRTSGIYIHWEEYIEENENEIPQRIVRRRRGRVVRGRVSLDPRNVGEGEGKKMGTALTSHRAESWHLLGRHERRCEGFPRQERERKEAEVEKRIERGRPRFFLKEKPQRQQEGQERMEDEQAATVEENPGVE